MGTSIGRAFEDWLRTHLARRSYARSFDQLQLEGDERVLEMGVGGGQAARVLLPRIPRGHYTGVDTDPWWVERARRNLRSFPNVEVLLGDVRDLPLVLESFDLAVVHIALHDVPGPDRSPIVERLAHLLRPGGRLFIKEPTKEGHGMPASEIWDLAEGVGLKEARKRSDHTRWLGPLVEAEFVRP
jgi:SAM-dependent methyltransferase